MTEPATSSRRALLASHPTDVSHLSAVPTVSYSRLELVVDAIHKGWKRHCPVFCVYLTLSIAAVTLLPFSDVLSTGNAFIVASGGWLGLVGCLLYFLPISLEHRPLCTKTIASWILVLSVLAAVTDFPVVAGMLWAIKNDDEEEEKKASEDEVLIAASVVLFFHGCTAVVAAAKCMIMGTYELPPGEARYV